MAMIVADSRRSVASSQPPRSVGWIPTLDPPLVELLDHLSRELAQEYVTLMEIAAEREIPPEP